MENFPYSCTWMKSKIIEVGLLFVYTHVLYVTIPCMDYMAYEDNLDNIIYGV